MCLSEAPRKEFPVKTIESPFPLGHYEIPYWEQARAQVQAVEGRGMVRSLPLGREAEVSIQPVLQE